MPDCLHPTCKREDLPAAPAFPPRAKVACAHVTPKGDPCPMSPDVETYDLEALVTIVTEDKLWDIGVEPAPATEAPASKPLSEIVSDGAARFDDRPITRASLAARSELGKLDKADREFAIEHGLENASAQEIRAARMTTPATAPAKPAKRGKKAPTPATSNVQAQATEDDVDDWNP